MILILADPSDPWGSALARRLAQRGQVCLYRAAHQIERAHALDIEPLEGAVTDLTGIFWGTALLGEDEESDPKIASASRSVCDWLADTKAASCRVVNRPIIGKRLSRLIGSPVWEALLRAHSFQPVPVHIVSHREEAIACLNAREGTAYVKRQGSERGGLVLSPEEAIAYAGTYEPNGPLLLVQVPAGQLVSVFVVGGCVAGTVVRTGRRAESSRSMAHLGSSLLASCGELAQSLELSFAECVLVMGPEGEVSCLDIIGAPNYWTCPRDVQPHVVNQLAVYLSGERSLARMVPLRTDAASEPGAYTSVGDPDGR